VAAAHWAFVYGWRSVKYEDVYLKGYVMMKEVKAGLKKYFRFYNEERFHQGLDDRTPDEVYYIQGEEMSCLIYLRTTDHWSANQGPLPCSCGVL